MRDMLRAPEDKPWVYTYALGELATNFTISKVINSSDTSYKEGDLVIEEYSIISSQSLQYPITQD
jgi:NADPH-dependent curcumin reductase CurA